MAKKGELKEPVLSLDEAHAKALDMIDGHEEGCALFFVGGSLHATSMHSKSYENNVARLASGLVGVYTLGADPRSVREDLAEFYKSGDDRPTVLPSLKWKDRIFEVLEEGPSTPREIAEELSLPVRVLSAYISQLGRDGYIKVIGKTKGPAGGPTQIWAKA